MSREAVRNRFVVTLVPEVAGAVEEREADSATPRRRLLLELAPAALYLLGGLFVTARLWPDPDGRAQANNVQDQGFFTFVLAHAARSVTHLSNPFFDGQLNVPAGVNMMANTSVLGLSVPLAPVTLLAGPAATYPVLLALAPFLTATTWYLVLSRHVVRSRLAAFVAGGFCGFAPGIVSQTNGHPNVAAQFLIPLILLQLAKLRTGVRPVRIGVTLGLLVVWQAFINEELLLFTAVAGALMVLVYGVSRRPALRPVLRAGLTGLGVAAAVAAALLAYPLWYQFFGPQHYDAVPSLSVALYSDLGSYVSYPTQSLAGVPPGELGIRAHFAEENAYFGWPLVVLAAVGAVWLWRHLLVRAAVVVGLVFAAMSLGRVVTVYGHETGIPGPYRLVSGLPLIESVVPVRFALMVIPAVGVLLATVLDRVVLDRVVAAPGRTRRLAGPQLIWYAAFLGALVPLFPTPLPVSGAPRTPAFVSAGTWRQYVPAGRSVLFVPVPTFRHVEGQRWSARQEMDLPIAGGYFLGPGPDARALYGAPPRPSATLLDDVADTGQVPAITDADRQRMVEDLRYWRTAVVVIGPVPRADALRAAVHDLLRADPQWIGGAWVWDVRTVVG